MKGSKFMELLAFSAGVTVSNAACILSSVLGFPRYSSYSSYRFFSSLHSPSSVYWQLFRPRMRLPRNNYIRHYLATALCQILVTILILQLVSRVTAAPAAFSISKLASLQPCQQVGCLTDNAVPDPDTGACICPGSTAFRASLPLYINLHKKIPDLDAASEDL